MSEMSPEIAERRRVLWMSYAWGAGLLLTALPLPLLSESSGLLSYFVLKLPFYPLGFMNLVTLEPVIFDLSSGERLGWSLFGWLCYPALRGMILAQRRRVRFFIGCALPGLLLALNAVGCNVQINDRFNLG